MSRIAAHVVAGILFVGVGTTGAQESIPKPAVVEMRDALTSTAVVPTSNEIAPSIPVDEPNGNIEGRQNPARSPQDASDSPRAKAGTSRRWFSGAMLWMVEFLAGGLVYTGGR